MRSFVLVAVFAAAVGISMLSTGVAEHDGRIAYGIPPDPPPSPPDGPNPPPPPPDRRV